MELAQPLRKRIGRFHEVCMPACLLSGITYLHVAILNSHPLPVPSQLSWNLNYTTATNSTLIGCLAALRLWSPFKIWHAIELGCHTDIAMSTFFITLAAVGIGLLVHLYWQTPASKNKSVAAVAKTQS